MKRYCVIIGLRAYGPTILGGNVPGYLKAATEDHRKGFQLPNGGGWYAFTSEPLDAILFNTEEEAEAITLLLIENDKGWFRPLTLMWLYK